MKKQISQKFRVCAIAVLGLAVFAGAAGSAERMNGRQCRQDWRAHKAMYKQEGKSRRMFMRECRSGTVQPAAPAPVAH